MTDDAALLAEVAALRLTLERVMKERGAAVLSELKLSQEVAAKEAESARRDPLTSLLRHGFFRMRLAFEIERSAQTGEPLGLVLVDLDRFAAFNDARGYAEGERVLSVLARGIQSVWLQRGDVRPPVIGREGGNRFGGIFPGLARDDVEERAEDARAFVERFPSAHRLTASVGVAVCISTALHSARHDPKRSGAETPAGSAEPEAMRDRTSRGRDGDGTSAVLAAAREARSKVALVSETALAALDEAKRAGGNQVVVRAC